MQTSDSIFESSVSVKHQKSDTFLCDSCELCHQSCFPHRSFFMFCEVSFWLGRCLRAISTVDNKMTRWVIEQSYFLPSLATLFHFSLFPRLFASHFTRETRQMLHPAPFHYSQNILKRSINPPPACLSYSLQTC